MDELSWKNSMKHVVITGSTQGIGFGLAGAFLKQGCAVTVSGRAQTGVDQACKKLEMHAEAERFFGNACDVRDPEQVTALWEAAFARFGKVDIWINNAGLSGQQAKVWQIPPGEARQVVETNLLGVIHGSRVAVRGMLEQGFGSIYNMEGMGSDGRKHDGLALYGTTKYGLRYFTDSLVQETADTPLIIGSLRPGMVVTELITRQYADRPAEWQRAKRVFNLIAERVEVVTPWLAEQVLANERSGVRITYLTRGRMLKRMMLMPFRKRELFHDGD